MRLGVLLPTLVLALLVATGFAALIEMAWSALANVQGVDAVWSALWSLPVLLFVTIVAWLQRRRPRRSAAIAASAVALLLLAGYLSLRYAQMALPALAASLVIGVDWLGLKLERLTRSRRVLRQELTRLAEAVFDATGNSRSDQPPVGSDAFAAWIAEIHRDLATLHDSHALLSGVFDGSPVAMILQDQERVLLNTTAQTLLGLESRVAPAPFLEALAVKLAGTPRTGEFFDPESERHFVVNQTRLMGDREMWLWSVLDVSATHHLKRQRDQLLTFFMHDLRHPLSSILAVTGDEHVAPTTPTPQQFVEIRRLARLGLRWAENMAALLQASTLEPKNFKQIPLHEVIDEAVQTWWTHARAVGIELALVGNDEVTVRGHRESLLRVVSNILHNAIEHSPPGSSVILVSTRSPLGTQFRARNQVLEPGKRRPGLGLGLRYVESVAKQHGVSFAAGMAADGEHFEATLHFLADVLRAPPSRRAILAKQMENKP